MCSLLKPKCKMWGLVWGFSRTFVSSFGHAQILLSLWFTFLTSSLQGLCVWVCAKNSPWLGWPSVLWSRSSNLLNLIDVRLLFPFPAIIYFRKIAILNHFPSLWEVNLKICLPVLQSKQCLSPDGKFPLWRMVPSEMPLHLPVFAGWWVSYSSSCFIL